MARYFLDARIEEGRGDHARRHRRRRPLHLSPGAGAGQPRRQRAEGERRRRPKIACSSASATRVEFAAAFFGVLKIGAVVTMVNPELPDGDYEHYLDYTRARAFVGERALAERIRAAHRDAASSCARRHHRGAGGGGRLGRAGRARLAGARQLRHLARRPVGVAVHLGLDGQAQGARSTCTTTSPTTPSATPSACSACGADDVTLGVPKLFFGYATGTNLMFPFAVGATTVLFRDRATPEQLFELCARAHGRRC